MNTKTALTALITLLIGLIAGYFIANASMENKPQQVTEPVVNDFTKNPSYITREQAIKEQDLYVSTIHNKCELLDQNGQPLNAQWNREFNFKLADFKEFLAYVEAQGKKGDYKDLGVRAYLSAKMDGNGKLSTDLFFVPSGFSSLKSSNGGTNPPPNIPGSGGFNHSTSGMPPTTITMP